MSSHLMRPFRKFTFNLNVSFSPGSDNLVIYQRCINTLSPNLLRSKMMIMNFCARNIPFRCMAPIVANVSHGCAKREYPCDFQASFQCFPFQVTSLAGGYAKSPWSLRLRSRRIHILPNQLRPNVERNEGICLLADKANEKCTVQILFLFWFYGGTY